MIVRKSSIWVLLNFICFIICFVSTILNHVEHSFWILPMIYSTCLFLFRKNREFIGKVPGLTVIHGTMFCRYTLVPIILCTGNELSRFAKDYSHISMALVIMVYEMLAIFCVLELTSYKSKRVYNARNLYNANGITIRPSILIVSLVIIVLIGIYFTNRSMMSGISLITTGSITDEENIEGVSSFAKIIWQCMTAWFYVYGINCQKEKYEQNNEDQKYVYISVIFTMLMILVAYIGQISISRWYTLVTAIASMFLLREMFPKEAKKMVVMVSVPVVLLMVSASIFKSGSYVADSGERFWMAFSGVLTATSADAYFAGPVSVNNAIGFCEDMGVGIINMLYDVCNNMPIVNHIIPQGRSTAYLYNVYLGRAFGGRGDQIIPLVGQSYTFFTVVLSPLLSVVSVILLRWADNNYIKSTNYMKYVWSFVAVWYGLASILNMTINLSWLYIRIIPLAVVFWCINVISTKKMKN